MSAVLRVPEVDEWSLSTEGPLGTGFSAPRGVKDLLRQRRGSCGEGRRPTTSSSQPVTPPIMPDEDARPRRCSRKAGERLPAVARPDVYDLEPEPEPSPETDREHEERERRQRRRRKKHAKQHAHEGERAEVASRDPSSGSRGPSRQRTPEYPLAAAATAADKQSPRARKAAQRVAEKAAKNSKDEACRISDEARARRRDKMQTSRKGESHNSRTQRGSCQTPHATPGGGEGNATQRAAATSAQIRLLVETESTQTDDELLQELLRRRRAYLNEQSQLDGQESASVIKAHDEADHIFAQAAQRAREEAMKTVDASTCLKAALWNGSSQHYRQQRTQQQLAAPQQSPVPGTADHVSVIEHAQHQTELRAPDAIRAEGTDIGGLADAAKQAAGAPVPIPKNTRGFRLRR